MYDRPDSQCSQLVRVVRRAETKTPGSGVPEVRSKSAVVGIDSKSRGTSSDPPWKLSPNNIAHLMSAAITNQYTSSNGAKHNNGNGKFLTQKAPKDHKNTHKR